MRRESIRSGIGLALATLALSAAADAPDPANFVASTELQWQPTEFGPFVHSVSGDFSQGAHITYVKFAAGMKTPLHTHSAAYVGVVLSGTTRHWIVGRPETAKLLPAGSHWAMPAQVRHISECLPGLECVMALYQDAAFDFVAVEPNADEPDADEPVAEATLSDGEILAIYNQVNGFDIETGQLGSQRARHPALRALAAQVARDHSQVRDKANEVAKRNGIEARLPAAREQATREHNATLRRLRQLSGAAFDRAYLQHEIAFHRAAIAAVKQQLLPAVSNPELANFMHSVLPGFEAHLQHTEALAKQLGYL